MRQNDTIATTTVINIRIVCTVITATSITFASAAAAITATTRITNAIIQTLSISLRGGKLLPEKGRKG